MSGFTKEYNIYPLFIHMKLESNIAIKNVLKLYLTTTTNDFAWSRISPQKVRTLYTLREHCLTMHNYATRTHQRLYSNMSFC